MPNAMDNLSGFQDLLHRSGHDTWGWVVYRCTYVSDPEWSRFMDTLKAVTEKSLEFYGKSEWPLAKQLVWTVNEDRARLDNASKSEVRKIFNAWVSSAAAAAEQPKTSVPHTRTRMARYRYCIHIDETSIRSVLDESQDWHVNIINRDWIPEDEEEPVLNEWDDEEADDEVEPEVWPPIDGCTEEDVGWFKGGRGVLLDGYVTLCSPNVWYWYYRRPPQIVR